MDSIVQAALILITAPPSIIGAILLQNRQQRLFPDAMPFRWGYYNGIQFTLVWIVAIVLASFAGTEAGTVAFLVFGLLLYGFFSVFTLLRRRWAFICLTILALNPVSWIINGYYIRNRRGEFKNSKVKKPPKDADKSEVKPDRIASKILH